jgi:two-component system cell cycle sensor histidine kinase/response regulator CckA
MRAMSIQTRIISAAILAIAIATIAYSVYFLQTERENARARLQTIIEEDDKLLKVVVASPLYDGNIEQLDATLDSFFSNPDMVRIDLSEYKGNIRMSRVRAPAGAKGETITSRMVIIQGIDELGEIITTYSTARLEQALQVSRNQVLFFSGLLALGLSGIIYLVVKGLTRPIERLTVAARDIADGHLEREIDIRGAEELQSLGQSFIRMRDAVREKMADLAGRNEALRISEDRLRSVVENTPVVLFALDQQGLFTFSEGKGLAALGYKPGQVVGLSAFDIYHGSPSALAGIRRALTGEEFSILTEIAGLVFEVWYSPVRNAAGELIGTIGVGTDITERKWASEALRESEERLQQAVRASQIGIFDHNHQTDTIYWSPQQRQNYGWGPDEPVTMAKFIDQVFPEDRERIAAAVRHAHDPAGDGLFDVEHRIIRRDGEVRWLSTRSQTFFEGTGDARRPIRTVGGVIDITERKRAEDEQQKLVSIIETSSDFIGIADLRGRLLYINAAGRSLVGLDSIEEAQSMRISDFLREQDLAVLEKEQMPTIYRTGSWRGELALRHVKTGVQIPVEMNAFMIWDRSTGRPIALANISRDITERKRVEQALAQEKAFSDLVIDSLPGVFYICDQQRRLIRWNDNEKAVTGYTWEELSQMSLLTLFPHDQDLMADHLRDVFDTGRASVEASLVTKSGLPIPYYLTGSRMTINDQRYLIGAGIDISKRKALEQQLLQAQKMEAVGQLAGGIAHDFNNILAAIIGYGSIMQKKMGTDDPNGMYLDNILTSAQSAASLTQSLLAFSRKQVISPRNIDLNVSIRKVEKFLTRIIGEDIALTTTLSSEALMIWADVTQIEQVLMNLATNARDAMPKGGRLVIEAAHVMLDDEYVRTTGYGTPGPYAQLNVSDTGDGMDEETQKKIFEPFFTSKKVGKGTGLGLAIVYGIVKQNNGYINVYSEVGKGTTFKIYLPLIKAGAEEVQSTEVPVPVRGGTETILVAEDNEVLRLLKREVLQEVGYTVIEAADGEEALQKFREHPDSINLFILDVIMPKKNGREVFREARKSNPDVKALFTSGYPADLIKKEGVLEKGLHFLPKPSSPEALLRKVRELLDQ